MTLPLKKFAMLANMSGQCTVYVNATNKLEALTKIMRGEWDDATPEGWDVDLPEEEFTSVDDVTEVEPITEIDGIKINYV